MSTSVPEPGLAGLELLRPLEAEIPRSPGVYSWWLDTSRFPAPEDVGLTLLPCVPRSLHGSGEAELLYVGRARRNLHQRINSQHLRRTRSSALRRTLLAVLLRGEPSWRNGAHRDSRGRLILDADDEDRLTGWMHKHLEVGWVPCEALDVVDALEKNWICEHQPVLNTDGTDHGPQLSQLKRSFLDGLPRRA